MIFILTEDERVVESLFLKSIEWSNPCTATEYHKVSKPEPTYISASVYVLLLG